MAELDFGSRGASTTPWQKPPLPGIFHEMDRKPPRRHVDRFSSFNYISGLDNRNFRVLFFHYILQLLS